LGSEKILIVEGRFECEIFFLFLMTSNTSVAIEKKVFIGRISPG